MSRPEFDPLALWVGARLAVPALAVLLLPNLLGDRAARALRHLPYPHGTVKWALESSQGLLLRQQELPFFVLGAAALAVGLTLLRGRAWVVGALATVALPLLVPHYGVAPMVLVAGLVAVAGLPLAWLSEERSVLRKAAWIPGTTLLFPSVVGGALGTPARPALHRALVGLVGATLGLLAVWTDCLAHYDQVRAGMERWPDALLDPELRVLGHSEPGVRADWHGVQIVGDHAIVVAETTTRLMAFPLAAPGPPVVFDLADRWGMESAAPLDAETDPETGLTWLVDGGEALAELRWTGATWEPQRRLRLPRTMSYAYLRRTPEDRLIVASVQIAGPTPRTVVTGTLPDLGDLSAVDLVAEGWSPPPGGPRPGGRRGGPPPARGAGPPPARGGGPPPPGGHGPPPDGAGPPRGDELLAGGLPMPREIEWIPSIGKMAVAPDFGGHLWLADLETGVATPWVETPTLDGKMRYSAALDRLVVALPNRVELWVIDPHTGAVDWTVPTQPGVRSLAIDDTRGLVVTASVLTGHIQVQDLRTGEVHKRLGTVMPMVRELALSPERGEAVLSTWVATYTFPYVDP